MQFKYSQVHMGLRVDVSGFAENESQAEAAAKHAFAAFERVDAVMSDYRRDSELMKLCASQHQVYWDVSDDLWTVFVFAQELSRASNGAFDITCGPLVQLWRATRKTGKMPNVAEFTVARQSSGFTHLVLSEKSRSACLMTPGMRLDLGGIAKGYACDLAIEAMRLSGVERAMVHAGGDMAFSGSPPGKPGWTVLIDGHDGKPLRLSHCALSTSGDSQQYYEIEGKRYSHILDPRTGLGLVGHAQVTVIAKKSMVADALATALCVAGEATGRALAMRYDATALFVPR